MTSTPKVGAEVEAQCGRCHDATVHKIVALDKGRPKRVLCNGCEATHLYRAPKGPEPAKPRGRSRKRAPADPVADALAAYEKALKTASGDQPVAYALSGAFQEGQRVKHKRFGEGVVLSVPRPRIMEVVFKDGVRKLAIGR
jgi:hypothetical protein